MKSVKSILKSFARARILVIGDLILDEYIWGDVDRISPEAPVPVVWAKKRTFVPGGASNVAVNLASLGARVSVAGVVGKDQNGQDRHKDHYRSIILEKLKEKKIDTRGIIEEAGRHTTLKTRIFAKHQQVVRVDWEDVEPLKKQTQDSLERFIMDNIRIFDAVIIEDYGKGVFNKPLLSRIISEARSRGKIITVDPKEDNFESYWGVTSITPNRKEAENAVRYLKMQDKQDRFRIYSDKLQTAEEIKTAGKAILSHLNLESLLLTLGENGMWLFEKGSDNHIPTVAQEVFDVTGAGDTAIATFTLALACGATKFQAAQIANSASGIVVGKVGTATVTAKELLQRINLK